MNLTIAGLQKVSLIDYPGKIAGVVFLSGCNFHCPYCHNPELALGRQPCTIQPDQLVAFLSQRHSLLEGVVISGGEPTLQPQLADLCRAIRSLDLSVKLDTNGSRPAVLAQLLEEHLVDYVALDVKTDPARYGPPLAGTQDGAALRRSIDLLLEADIDSEFRTTCVAPFVDATVIKAIACAIEGARRYCLQSFRPHHLLDPDFWPEPPVAFSSDEMLQLQALAAPWVANCLIR